MIERYIQAVNIEAPGMETPAETRERLKGRFPSGTARRMTQLGMLIGSVLGGLEPADGDAVVYASAFGESRALESFLESFPGASPTLFQTSIHPSGVQQGLIGRQRSVSELFPFVGAGCGVGHALLTAMLSPVERVLFCGGEERGTWLRELGVASEKTFAFGVEFGRSRKSGTLARVAVLTDAGNTQKLSLVDWFKVLEGRRSYDGPLMPGSKLQFVWENP